MNITRSKIGQKWEYKYKNTKITDNDTIHRIKKLGIPPNWKNIEISKLDTNYLQATGVDAKGRTQYIYHPMWIALSTTEKYSRLANFTKKLPSLTRIINKKLSEKINTSDKEFIIALMFRILTKTHARIGNDCYADENNTYGLTTLLKKHIRIDKNNNILLSFVGKKGVKQDLRFKDTLSAKILNELLKIPGDRLFKTQDVGNFIKNGGNFVKAIEMNDYLKNALGSDFTCKDFRTYASNALFLKILCKKDAPTSVTGAKRNVKETYDEVANELGHTRAISKKSYVIPLLEEQYLINPAEFVGKNGDKILKNILKDF
jgi:DNA topoisomerase-1